MTREELRSDLLKYFPEFSAEFEFADAIPKISEPLLIIRDFRSLKTESMKISFAFELTPILNKTLTNKCWITTKNVIVLLFHSPYEEFEHKGEYFYPYSVAFGKYNGNVSAEKLNSICKNIYDGNIAK